MARKTVVITIIAEVDADVTSNELDNAAWEAHVQVNETEHFEHFGSTYSVATLQIAEGV